MIISSLGIWPGSLDFQGRSVKGYASIEFSGAPVGYLPFIAKALLWFIAAPQRPQTLAERTAVVAAVRVSPHKLVGYVGDRVSFAGMGVDGDGQPAHGAKFEWESSDTSKLTIDEAGRASLLAPGIVIVTARAGAAMKTAPVLIRPTRRRVQTDAEWRADQDSLVASAGSGTDNEKGIGSEAGNGSELGIGNILASLGGHLATLGDRLMPTAYAQGGGQGVDFGNAAPIGQVGTPPFAGLEETRLGPVMPQTNFELPISLVDLEGRGLAINLMAYYNSNPWGAYVDGLGATHYVFDPIQGWPSPGFSLGFGRIVIYSYAGPGYQYLGSQAIQSVVSTDETGQQTKVDFDYDSNGNVVNRREYGFKISGAWQARRRTHYSYINWEPYLSAYIRDRAWMVEVFDALQNTSDADDVLIGKTVMAYDNPLGGMEGYGGTANPPGHLSSYNTSHTTRGNLTSVTKYPDLGGAGVSDSNKTDIFGNVTKAQVACCDEKSFTMTETTYWTKPSQTTIGSTSGIYLTSSAGYDFNTLTTTSNTDPNNQTTTYSYDAAQRPTGFTSPTGASGSTIYNVWGEATSSSVTWNEGGTNKTVTKAAVYDAWGQMTQEVDAYGAQTNYAYNNMGRMITRTNPFPQGGTPGPVTSYQYDQLGRATVVTLPGGNTIQTAYSGSVVTATDQVNRKMKRETDGLRRLIKVTEQDSTGALAQETNYSYSLLDKLTLVNQGNQTRSFKYDAEGRLLFERIPEMSATINDGTGTMCSTKYTYTERGRCGYEARRSRSDLDLCVRHAAPDDLD